MIKTIRSIHQLDDTMNRTIHDPALTVMHLNLSELNQKDCNYLIQHIQHFPPYSYIRFERSCEAIHVCSFLKAIGQHAHSLEGLSLDFSHYCHDSIPIEWPDQSIKWEIICILTRREFPKNFHLYLRYNLDDTWRHTRSFLSDLKLALQSKHPIPEGLLIDLSGSRLQNKKSMKRLCQMIMFGPKNFKLILREIRQVPEASWLNPDINLIQAMMLNTINNYEIPSGLMIDLSFHNKIDLGMNHYYIKALLNMRMGQISPKQSLHICLEGYHYNNLKNLLDDQYQFTANHSFDLHLYFSGLIVNNKGKWIKEIEKAGIYAHCLLTDEIFLRGDIFKNQINWQENQSLQYWMIGYPKRMDALDHDLFFEKYILTRQYALRFLTASLSLGNQTSCSEVNQKIKQQATSFLTLDQAVFNLLSSLSELHCQYYAHPPTGFFQWLSLQQNDSFLKQNWIIYNLIAKQLDYIATLYQNVENYLDSLDPVVIENIQRMQQLCEEALFKNKNTPIFTKCIQRIAQFFTKEDRPQSIRNLEEFNEKTQAILHPASSVFFPNQSPQGIKLGPSGKILPQNISSNSNPSTSRASEEPNPPLLTLHQNKTFKPISTTPSSPYRPSLFQDIVLPDVPVDPIPSLSNETEKKSLNSKSRTAHLKLSS